MKTGGFRLPTWWKTVLIITMVLAIVVYVPRTINPRLSFPQVAEIIVNLALVFISALGAWQLYDARLVRKRKLMEQIRSQDANAAKNAISELNAEGFLADGTLIGANLVGSQLLGVDLKATDKNGTHIPANLKNVNFKQSYLNGADLREAILTGANLELVNFEGANLMGADLSQAKFYITNLVGVCLLGANLTGARFAGEICDETTQLPDGSHWDADLNWSRFDAIEELPDYARRVLGSKPEIRQTINPPEYENGAQRQQDMMLLSQLWKHMNTQNLIRLDDSTQYRTLEDNFYSENFSRYLYERKKRAELRFISPAVEAQFAQYDQVLREFNYQLFQSAGVEDFHGRQIVRPDYKQRGLKYDIEVFKRKEWDKTIDKLLELRRIHDELVTFLKKKFPEFNFLDNIETDSE